MWSTTAVRIGAAALAGAAVLTAGAGPPAAARDTAPPPCTTSSAARAQDARPLNFGIYPGGYAGGGTTNPVPNDPAKMQRALDRLQGGQAGFLVRGYMQYQDAPTDGTGKGDDPADVVRYLGHGRRLDLVLEYAAKTGNIDGWLAYLKKTIKRYGRWVDTLSVTLEANSEGQDAPGDLPRIREALVKGVIVAKQESVRLGYQRLRVGFDVAGFGDPSTAFWKELGGLGGRPFVDAVDYVGVDIYPDVFVPAPPDGSPGDLRDQVKYLLHVTRDCSMPLAGLTAAVPIRVSENGWPTSPDRSEARQAEALPIVIRTINEVRGSYNVAGYELFDLRDARTSSSGIFDRFGIMRDDYTPKPAFEAYRRLVAELGGPS